MASDKFKALHIQVAEKLIEQLKTGTAPWQQPWSNSNPISFELPYNAVTGNRYKGINSISLMLSEYKDPRWATFRQAAVQGWQVKKGEQGSMIQFVKINDWVSKRDQQGKQILDQDGQPVKTAVNLSRPIVTSAWVFNAEQITGMPPLQQQQTGETWKAEQRAEKLIANTGASITHRLGNDAFYDPVDDFIQMPDRQQFDSSGKYYATLLHELGHWTGHHSRLDRSVLNKFGNEAYAREELRAEIASLLVGQELKIGHDPAQHTAYVQDWIRVLTDSPFEIHLAAADAEKIFNYLLAFEQKRTLDISSQSKNQVPNSQIARSARQLFIGEEIPYKNTVYKVEGLLKQGRLKMQDLTAGNSFTLSRSDGLYQSLTEVKYAQQLAKFNNDMHAGPSSEAKSEVPYQIGR